jgi:hypothetical protein
MKTYSYVYMNQNVYIHLRLYVYIHFMQDYQENLKARSEHLNREAAACIQTKINLWVRLYVLTYIYMFIHTIYVPYPH